jgi:WD40 repeat protein
MRFVLILLLLAQISFAADSAEHSFTRVAEIFAKHCLDCHAVDDPEGKFIVENHDLIMKGGESGPAVIPGKSDDSLLVKMIEGKFEKDGKVKFMPPGKRGKLTPEEIAAVRAWVDAGAPAPKDKTVVAKEIVVPKITPTVAPRRAIHALAYTAHGNLLAVARNGEVELFSTESQSLIRKLEGPTGNVNAAAFTSDGKTLYAAGGDVGISGEIRAWNVADGKILRTINGHTDAIYALALSPDGKTLATGSYDQKIKLWSTESGAELRTLTGHNGCIYGLSFRADGKILASASGDRTIKLWDVATGERRDTLSQPLKEQYTVQFSPDGSLLAAAGVDKRIRVWQISAEATETTNPLLHSKFGHEGAILNLTFSQDGKSLISSAEDKTVKLWEVPSFKEKRVLAAQPDWPPALAFINENKAVAVGRLDGTFAFYNSESGEALAPPKPELARVEPRGLQRGITTKLKLVGKHLQNASAIKFSDTNLSANILNDPAPKPTELWIEVTSASTLTGSIHELSAVTPAGETAKQKLHIDDLPQLVETESASAQKLSTLPITIWGAHAASGDSDLFQFTANAGDQIIFDAAAKSLGSKADLVLRLLDTHGKVIASNNNFDSTGDPLLAHKFSESGDYQLQVEELVLGGSADHFYRVSVGAFPFVTAVYPPVVAPNAETELELIGHNLLPEEFRIQKIQSTDSGALAVKLDAEKVRWRGDFKVQIAPHPLALESEPNDTHTNATTMQAPGIATGRFLTGDREDWFRFDAKAGQEWIIETAAARLGSPADTRIEVRDQHGKPILRTLLQAVRESAVTFRGIDSVTADCRVENWEEMELNQYLYLGGEVVRLFRAPQGPDSGFLFYTLNGKRRNYFDTTASAHADAAPCYIVEPHPPGAKLVPNGLPVFEINFENDDDADRKLGTDSRLYFHSPADGTYFVRVTDTRSFSGDRNLYSLTIRPAAPAFNISIEGMNPTIAKGSGQRFAVNADRIDGFDGEIRVEISDVPSGFTISNPIIVQAGHSTAFGTINANSDAVQPPSEHRTKIPASAEINGQRLEKTGATLGKITLADTAPLYVTLESPSPEIIIAPGGIVPAMLKIRRNGHNELVTFQVENLPHGIIVDNIGLNGVLIPKDQNEREIFFRAERWVPETDRLAYAVSNEAGRQTSLPVLIKVRRTAGQVATSR